MDLLRSCEIASSMQWVAVAKTSHDTMRAFSAFSTFNMPGFGAGSGNRLGDTIMACSNKTVLPEWRPDNG
jgi:hypothetical protein